VHALGRDTHEREVCLDEFVAGIVIVVLLEAIPEVVDVFARG
jgi:hypothetical protein